MSDQTPTAPSKADPLWPCPNGCINWRRSINPRIPMTNHHPNCEYVDKSLIDVWRVSYDGGHYFSDQEPLTTHQRETITKEKMHREIYEHLPEFNGF